MAAVGSTPAIQAAVQAGVAHVVHEYDHDPSVTAYGAEAAQALGFEPALIHKTLVVDVERNGRRELVVAVVPVDAQLDLKALATAVDGKRAEMAAPAAAERSSGYVVGGISPLGQRKPLLTVIDEDAVLHDTIHVSAGRRGLEIELAAEDLRSLTNGIFAAIARRQH
jgi:Cys-tRNA(Pro)/Cys-tRNA(Cys) deacylase